MRAYKAVAAIAETFVFVYLGIFVSELGYLSTSALE